MLCYETEKIITVFSFHWLRLHLSSCYKLIQLLRMVSRTVSKLQFCLSLFFVSNLCLTFSFTGSVGGFWFNLLLLYRLNFYNYERHQAIRVRSSFYVSYSCLRHISGFRSSNLLSCYLSSIQFYLSPTSTKIKSRVCRCGIPSRRHLALSSAWSHFHFFRRPCYFYIFYWFVRKSLLVIRAVWVSVYLPLHSWPL